MYINNINNITSNYYIFNNLLGNYLVNKGVPLLSRKNNKMIFSKNKDIDEILKCMPFYLKILRKLVK